jgi:predicted  nucleic acid-binding Zn-ribbon protein
MGPKKVTTPIKPPEVSSMTQEENEDIHNRLSKLEEQIKNVSEKSNNWVKSQRQIQVMEGKMDGMENNMEGMKNKMDDMENKMEENKNDIKREIRNSMKEMENMSSLIFQAIDERFPEGDIKNHENKGSTHAEQTANNKPFSESNSNSGVNSSGGPKFNFPKIELKKFDGTEAFTWVNQIE